MLIAKLRSCIPCLHQSLLQTRLVHDSPRSCSELLLNQMKVMSAGSEFLTMEMLRIRILSPVSGEGGREGGREGGEMGEGGKEGALATNMESSFSDNA